MKVLQRTLFILLGLMGMPALASIPVSAACGVNNICSSHCPGNDCPCFSHTFFRPRPIGQDLALEESLHLYNRYFNVNPVDVECPSCMTFEANGFYYRSTQRHKTAQFFLPDCQDCVSITQENTCDTSPLQISSAWLQLLSPGTPFQSQVCLQPRREAYGATLKFHFYFNELCNTDCFKYIWASVYMPIVHVRHSLHFTENSTGGAGTVLVNGVPQVDATTALVNNPAWLFGRFYLDHQDKTGIDDLSVRLGWDFYRQTCKNLSAYLIMFMPTGRPSQADYIFEPVYGTGHFGFGPGFIGSYQLWDDCDASLTALFEFRYAYFFKRNEVRSFDLCPNGQWSRYLLMSLQSDPNVFLPGINFLTREVSVTPRSSLEFLAALHYEICDWNLELGYNFWYRQREKICLPIQENTFGIYDIAGCCALRTSASTAQICQSIPGAGAPVSDSEFTAVRDVDLNICSAAHPRSLSSKLYGAIGYSGDCSCYPTLFGVGGFYEFAHTRAALSQFGIFVKASISY